MNPTTKRGLSVDEHRCLGAQLYEMRNLAVSLNVMLSKRYGKTKRCTRRAERLQARVDELRAELDYQLAREHPEDYRERVYCPGG